ncbi:Nuclease-related domain protein [Paraliobacillus sp. PM-2]|uniref:ATP-binding domain-containing protein n=1 Tax=Paraliobacillus sp. PM-2 TaxID=1462524 RepID=UPI00061C7A40|nr:nuclease-related domain-containing DEAD/DEAH box helicase [Paraliobacillus sp. PM-2]CQR46293.1 Nuclease-related domain protein [Paraliobacillus sp. PM-2]
MQGKFILTEPIGKDGERCEQIVWTTVQSAFANRECLAYWKYPVFSKTGEARREPDILIIDKDEGVIIIEVKGITIDQIVSMNGHQWTFRNFYQKSGSPYFQAEDQLEKLYSYFTADRTLRKKITGRVLISLPLITKKEWKERGFDKLPSAPPIIFKDDLSKSTFLSTIQNTTPIKAGIEINESRWNQLLSYIGGSTIYQKPVIEEQNTEKNSRRAIISSLNQKLSTLDIQQEQIGKAIPPGPQRIRGIAGSGKTILLCQKAAHMHLKHPDWNIALVFFTRSLYDQMISHIDRWIRHFSNGEMHYDPIKNDKLRVLHAWGARDRTGFYGLMCEKHGVPRLTANNVENKKPNKGLAKACKKLLEQEQITPYFDAVLIDEGQDLIVDDKTLLFENKQPIYWLAYQSLKPVDATNEDNRRLIWAYDEAQSLDTLEIPKAKALFGEALGHLVSGMHTGRIKKSEVMHRCYRTPGPILTAAHGLGMGLLRKDGMLRGFTTKENWQSIGYEIKKGAFKKGTEIELFRPKKNSPNIVPSLWKGDVFQFRTYNSRQEEVNDVAKKIKINIEKEGLQPSKEILVIILGSHKNHDIWKLERALCEQLRLEGVNFYIPSTLESNIFYQKHDRKNPDKFWEDDAVTVSRIHRAKGNEAEMVYVIGVDQIAQQESDIHLRNKLFVALTRAKAWVHLSGIGDYRMYEEINQVLASKNHFTFTFHQQPKQDLND